MQGRRKIAGGAPVASAVDGPLCACGDSTAASDRLSPGSRSPSAAHSCGRFASRRKRNLAFTLTEALVAISVVAVAGSVLLLAVESSVQTTWDAVDRTIADGVAQQVLDEVLTKRYMAAGAGPLDPSSTLGPNSSELAGNGRERFNDADDYKGFSAQPLEDLYGVSLGSGNDEGGLRHPNFRVPDSVLSNWRQRIEVYYVDPNDHSIRLTNSTSYYRAVEVHIEHVSADGSVRPLANRKRVYAYLPPPP